MISILERLRVWCITKLGGFVKQGKGSIIGQPDGTIKVSYMAEISNLDIQSHAEGVFTVRSIYNNGYPKVRAEYFDKDYFPDLHVLSKEDLEE